MRTPVLAHIPLVMNTASRRSGPCSVNGTEAGRKGRLSSGCQQRLRILRDAGVHVTGDDRGSQLEERRFAGKSLKRDSSHHEKIFAIMSRLVRNERQS